MRVLDGVLERPARALMALALLTLVFAWGLTDLQLRTDGAAVYPRREPLVARTAEDRIAFHETDQVIVLVTTRSATRLDTREGLQILKNLHASLEAVPGVERIRLRSVANLIDPQPGLPLMRTQPLLETIPEDPAAFARVLERLEASPLARGLLLSADGTAAVIYVARATHQARERFVERMETWARESATSSIDVRLAGPAAVEVAFGRKVLAELARFVPLMVLLIAALLYLCFRTWVPVLVVLAKEGLVLAWILGAMGHCGVPLTLVTTILPVVLLTMSITDEIHLLERIRRGSAAVGSQPGRLRAVLEPALADLALPMLMTSLTTAAGFLSFVSATADPIRQFGFFAGIGILVALLLTFTLVPALILVLPGGWLMHRPLREAAPLSFDRAERGLVARDAAGVLAGACLLLAFAPGLTRLYVQDSWIDNLDPRSELVSADRTFNEHFWGSYRFDVVLTAPRSLYFHQSEGLALLERVRDVAAGAPHAGGVFSALVAFDMAGRSEGHTGPVSELPARSLVTYSKLLQRASRTTDLDQVLTFDGRIARLRLFVKDANFARTREVEAYLSREVPRALAGSAVRSHFSGDLPATQSALEAIVGNLLRSLAWSLAIVGVLLAVAYRSLKSALLSLIPVALGVIIVLGGMGYCGIPLGLATSMFVAVAVGVGVDFSIHFRHAYRGQRRSGLDHRAALAGVIAGTGRSLRWNTLVLAVGISVLILSGLRPNRNLGILIASTVTICYATTLLVLPWLMRSERIESR